MNKEEFKEDIQKLTFSLPHQWYELFEKINNLKEGEELLVDDLKTIKVTFDKKEKK